MIEKSPRPGGWYSGWPIARKSLTHKMAFMGSLTAPILAALPMATALVPAFFWAVAFTALAVLMVGLLAHFDGRLAKQPGWDLIPARVLIASHEPLLRSMIGPQAAAPSRAPPSHRHLVGLTEPPVFFSAASLPRWFDPDVSKRA